MADSDDRDYCPCCPKSFDDSSAGWDERLLHLRNDHDLGREEAIDRIHSLEKRLKLARLQTQVGTQCQGWTWQTYPVDHPSGMNAIATVKRWLEEPSRTLLLYGGVGVGKTGLAFLLAMACLEDGEGEPDVEWVQLRGLLSALRQSFRDNSEPTALRHARDADLLVLDDLGVEKITEWGRDQLADLVEHRHANAKYTIVTSNYKPSDLAHHLGGGDLVAGQRIVSRLMEGATVIHLDRPDLRVRRS